MNAIVDWIWGDWDRIPSLPLDLGLAILRESVEMACQATHVGRIMIGRHCTVALPRGWVLEHIEAVAEPLIQLNTDWEFRRLLELFDLLDQDLLRRLALRAGEHTDPEIREAGVDFLR